MRTGLVSVTFRQLSAEQVLALAAGAGLQCLEWTADVHVRPGDLAFAREMGERTRAAGLAVAAYGSYYRLGGDDGRTAPFESVLETAAALGAPSIRVWTGNVGSAEADEAQWDRVAADAARAVELAAAAGIRVAAEFHAGTLTDTGSSARALLDRVPGLKTLWQPINGAPVETCEEDALRAVRPRLQHVHVFHWWPDHTQRHALAEGADRWARYLAILRAAEPAPDLLLEFVPGDDPEVLAREAATLRGWVAESATGG